MKKSVDILGLPVIDISEGSEIGTVKKIVINPLEGSIAALVIEDETWYLGAKLLPFTEISGLGESAITIASRDVILTVENAPALEQLLRTNVTIIGTKVLTKAGHLEGIVKELIIDKTGKITICEVKGINGEISNIPAQRILTFGEKVLIIADDSEARAAAKPEVKTVADITGKETAVKETANEDSARNSDEIQRKDLLGKQASRRIETDNGVLIVEQGGNISEEVLQKAKLAGKFVELSMSIE